jgi:hypothetical protein
MNLWSCRYRGKIVGKLACACSSLSLSVYSCSVVPSGFCCRELPSEAIDGPVALYRGGTTEARYVPFSASRRPAEPWMIVECKTCPQRA